MKIGDDASICVPGIDDPVAAKVSLISPALDPGSTTIEIWLKVDNKAGTLKVGTPVKVSITGRTVENALEDSASRRCSPRRTAAKSVMVVGADSAAQKKTVTLGIHDGEDVQVLSGVTPADMVITTGAYGLDKGTKVKIGKADEDDEAKPEQQRAETTGLMSTRHPGSSWPPRESFWLARSRAPSSSSPSSHSGRHLSRASGAHLGFPGNQFSARRHRRRQRRDAGRADAGHHHRPIEDAGQLRARPGHRPFYHQPRLG